jgi:hypothetical protein
VLLPRQDFKRAGISRLLKEKGAGKRKNWRVYPGLLVMGHIYSWVERISVRCPAQGHLETVMDSGQVWPTTCDIMEFQSEFWCSRKCSTTIKGHS